MKCPFEVQLDTSYNFKKQNYQDVSGVYYIRHFGTNALYVGATINLANRAHAHCEALRGKIYAPWLAKFARLHPDWEYKGSWHMTMIELVDDVSGDNLRNREAWWYELLKPKLNHHACLTSYFCPPSITPNALVVHQYDKKQQLEIKGMNRDTRYAC